MSLKIENSRRNDESRPVSMDLKSPKLAVSLGELQSSFASTTDKSMLHYANCLGATLPYGKCTYHFTCEIMEYTVVE